MNKARRIFFFVLSSFETRKSVLSEKSPENSHSDDIDDARTAMRLCARSARRDESTWELHPREGGVWLRLAVLVGIFSRVHPPVFPTLKMNTL